MVIIVGRASTCTFARPNLNPTSADSFLSSSAGLPEQLDNAALLQAGQANVVHSPYRSLMRCYVETRRAAAIRFRALGFARSQMKQRSSREGRPAGGLYAASLTHIAAR